MPFPPAAAAMPMKGKMPMKKKKKSKLGYQADALKAAATAPPMMKK